jgi:predicted GIY-YIG superfamily endonuclease
MTTHSSKGPSWTSATLGIVAVMVLAGCGAVREPGAIVSIGSRNLRCPRSDLETALHRESSRTEEYYVGLTSDPNARLQAHNEGLSSHTAGHRPWRTLVCIEFDEEEPATRFERYLKTGSGREFARRHFRQTVRTPRSATGSANC